MKCVSVRKLLPELQVRALDAEQASRVQEHLETCPDCRAANEELERVLRLFGQARVIEPQDPDQFLAKVRYRLAAEKRGRAGAERRLRLPWLVPVGAAAAVLLLAITLVLPRLVPNVDDSGSEGLAEFLTGSADYRLDPVSDGVVSDSLEAGDMALLEGVESELDSFTDVDELLDGLTEPEQDRLVSALEGLYGYRGS